MPHLRRLLLHDVLVLVDHPVCTDALARIRDRDTPNALFRQNLERIMAEETCPACHGMRLRPEALQFRSRA